MLFNDRARVLLPLCLVLILSACGNGGGFNLFGGPPRIGASAERPQAGGGGGDGTDGDRSSTIWDLFSNADDPNTTVEVNKYLWNASLDVLNFLPIQSVDPFTGVIVTGLGTPPGGGRSYRATIYVQDPALDARSLKVSLVGSNGQPVAPETARAVEDAILTRARELRIQDSRL
jgi:hypothetical protein